MAGKAKRLFTCTACGGQTPKWVGQCPDCGAWNTLIESISSESRYAGLAPANPVQRLEEVTIADNQRFSCGMAELDRVLGGGLVAGSVVLLGGDPGIGKSTVLLQSLAQLSKQVTTLYVTGEESVQQIALRAERLGLDAQAMNLYADNGLEGILKAARDVTPQVMVVDSIQTLYTDALPSAPGSVAQVRECAAQLVRLAKRQGTAVFLVGHVTKEGAIAGPRVLEHMVDTVLYFEGDRSSSFRLIRAIKNRFGAVNEVGVFAMTDGGLKTVTNPSAMFITREATPAPGRVVLVTQEGTRPLLVEVQALVDKSPLANPRRLTVGLDSSRLAMLLAVLHRHAGLALYDQDVFVNVVGGVRVHEPAADLAVALAVVSSLRNQPLSPRLAVFGEVGLGGEIRPVQRGQDRVREAAKLGFTRVLAPRDNRLKQAPSGTQLEGIGHIQQGLEAGLS